MASFRVWMVITSMTAILCPPTLTFSRTAPLCKPELQATKRAIISETDIPDQASGLDSYAELLKQRGWNLVYSDDHTVTARQSKSADATWVEIVFNGGGNYQIVSVSAPSVQ